MKYASNTEVSAEKSRAEIERTLAKYGATAFMYGYENTSAIVAFKIKTRQIKFILQMPDKTEKRFLFTPGRNLKRTSTQAYEAWEQATRQKWRALALVIKAKLEAVESGITTIEQEFLPFIVAADGRTVGEHLIPQLDQYCLSGGNLLLLPPAPKGTE